MTIVQRVQEWLVHISGSRLRRAACMVVLLALSACARESTRDQGSAVPGGDTRVSVELNMLPIAGARDSVNGIEQIKFDASAFDRTAQWTIDTNAITIAGGPDVDPSYDLTDVYHAVLFSDGGIATFAIVGAKVFMFSANGKPERIVGRLGQGPKEFMSPSAPILVSGDSLLILDDANKRMNWISRDGQFAVMKKLPVSSWRRATPLGVLSDGQLVLDGSGGIVDNIDVDTVLRSQSDVQLMKITQSELTGARAIATVPNFQLKRQETRYRGKLDNHTTVLGFTLHASISPFGGSIITGDGASYRLDVRNLEGQVVRQLQVAVPRRPVTQAMRDAMIALQLKRMDGPKSEGMVDANESRRLERERPFSDSLPAFQQTFVSPNGTLWVIDALALGDTSWSATAFNRDGAIVGRVHAPGFAYVMAFGDDRVLLRTEDADGVVSMRVHKLIPIRKP